MALVRQLKTVGFRLKSRNDIFVGRLSGTLFSNLNRVRNDNY